MENSTPSYFYCSKEPLLTGLIKKYNFKSISLSHTPTHNEPAVKIKSQLLPSGWHADPVRGETASAGDRPGSQGPRGRIQVGVEVQDLQHQQSVDLSGCDQEAAGAEGDGHGDHS